MITCKNCSTEFNGKFCPECGQKSATRRITMGQVGQDLRGQLVHINRGFLYTIFELTKRPGHSIREYLEGQRVRHVRPIKFMIWASAISFLIYQLLDFQERMIQQLEMELGQPKQSEQMGQKIGAFLSSHPSLILLCTVPSIAFIAWLLFRKRKYNYAEYFTLNAYLMGQLSVLSILISLVYYFMDHFTLQTLSIIGGLQWVVWLLYFGWAYSQFFERTNKILAWIKGILVLLGGYALLIMVVTLLSKAVLFFYRAEIEAWIAQ